MRRRIPVVIAGLGVLLLLLALLWKVFAPGQLVKYKTDVDKTPHEVGSVTLYVDPATTAPVAKPTTFKLDVEARLHVVNHTSSTVVVDLDQTQKIGPLPTAHANLQYVFNRRSMKNKTDDRAWAYQPSTVVDRSPNYAVIFPLHTGRGPYSLWKDETGSAFPATRVGNGTTKVGGTDLITMHGRIENAPVQNYYIATLRSQGIPQSLPLAQLAPQLKAQGIDPTLLTTTVLPRLSATDRATINSLLAQPVNLKYLLTGDTTWLVEPTTGVITSIAVDQTFSVQPDITAIGRIQTILSKPQYANDKTVGAGASTLAKLVAKPPTTRVLRVAYAQTPASVAEITSYAQSLADQQNLIERWIPLGLLVAGLVLLLVGIVLELLRRRRAPATPPAPPAATTGVGPSEPA
ncbi:MAG: porin PorA family protein [Frankia sp.]